MLLYGLRDKAFLHIIDPVLLYGQQDGSSLQLSQFTANTQDTAESKDGLQCKGMLNRINLKQTST